MRMKNLMKATSLALVVTALSSCYSGTPKGKTDSVATTSIDTGASTTVDTLPTTVDTTKNDTTKK